MKLNRTFLHTIALFAVLGIGAAPQEPAQAPAAEKTYLLRYKFKEGQSHEYAVEIHVKADIDDPEFRAEHGSEHTGHVEGLNTFEVSEAATDTFKVKIFFRGKAFQGTGIFEDAEEDLAGDTDSGLAKIDNLGNLLDGGEEDTDVHLTPILPEGPVKFGDTWDATIEEESEDGEEPSKVTGKLVGVEMLDGKELLRLEYEGVDLGFGPSQGPVVWLLDPETGVAHRFEATFVEEIEEGFKTEIKFVEKLQKSE